MKFWASQCHCFSQKCQLTRPPRVSGSDSNPLEGGFVLGPPLCRHREQVSISRALDASQIHTSTLKEARCQAQGAPTGLHCYPVSAQFGSPFGHFQHDQPHTANVTGIQKGIRPIPSLPSAYAHSLQSSSWVPGPGHLLLHH